MLRATLLLLAIAAPLTAQERVGAFHILVNADAFTDEETVTVFTEELEGTRMRTGGMGFQCDGQTVRALLLADVFLGMAREGAQVQWRFDQNEPSGEERWTIAPGNQGALAPSSAATAMLEQALVAERLVMRTRDFSGAAQTYSVSMDGAVDALARLPCTL